jgi:hypothetical protein
MGRSAPTLILSSTSLLTRTVIPFLQAMQRDEAAHSVSVKCVEPYPVPD